MPARDRRACDIAHPARFGTLISAALLGSIWTVMTPSLLAALGSREGSLQEPSAVTARPPSLTPESASGDGAVSDRMLAP